MKSLTRHITTNLLAGLVALLPIGGLILTVSWMESTLSSAGLTRLPFYFPGLGILLAVAAIYLIGLILTTVIGRWLWTRVDRLIHKLPALGKLYASLKQILGYGEGKDAIFQRVVLVPSQQGIGYELGLVTKQLRLPDQSESLAVFIPGSPNPTSGRLVYLPPDRIQETEIEVNQVFKALIAAGQYELTENSSHSHQTQD